MIDRDLSAYDWLDSKPESAVACKRVSTVHVVLVYNLKVYRCQTWLEPPPCHSFRVRARTNCGVVAPDGRTPMHTSSTSAGSKNRMACLSDAWRFDGVEH